MATHQPESYICPFCSFLSGKENEFNRREDTVYQNDFATALIAPEWWVNNPGHVLIIPNKHHENIYEIDSELLGHVYTLVKKVSIALRNTYGCQGVSTIQRNGSAAGQHVLHFHTHVFPRYDNDRLEQNYENRKLVDAAMRAPYAKSLRAYFSIHSG